MASLSAHEELILLRKRARRRLVGAVALVVTATAVLWTVVGSIPDRPMKPESVQISAPNIASTPAKAVQIQPPLVASGVIEAKAQPASAAQATDLVASLEPEATPIPVPEPKPVPVTAKPAPVTAQVVEPAKPKAEPKPEPKPTPKPQEKAEAKLKPAEKPKAVEVQAEPKRKKPDPAAILEGRADPEDAPAPKKDKPAEAKTGFVVQLAAMSDPAKADALKAKLAGSGVAARFSKVQTSKGEVTRVRVGPFALREEADAAVRRLAKAGVTGIVVSK